MWRGITLIAIMVAVVWPVWAVDQPLEPRLPELRQVLELCDELQRQLGDTFFKEVIIDDPEGIAIYRFYSRRLRGDVYIAWSNAGTPQPLTVLNGLFWILGCHEPGQLNDGLPVAAADIMLKDVPIVLLPCAPPSPVIASIAVEGLPLRPFWSEGDLWMSTWADDGCLYTGWGDGYGVAKHEQWSDCGIARLNGTLPDLEAQEKCYLAPTAEPAVNDKPSSLLSLDGKLIGAFHSPLGDAWIGYLAVSEDLGATWTRIGFHEEGDPWPEVASPWVRDAGSVFRCLFFIQMGQNYGLNTDGYVYALGIGTEWSWPGPVYLTRVPVADVLNYDAYEYYTGMDSNSVPTWNIDERRAVSLPGVRTSDQGSAMYHPELGRFLFLTERFLYDAPYPWGPWTYAGCWTGAGTNAPIQWRGGYQPGVISKDTGPTSFWFTISGQNQAPLIEYCFNLGHMVMMLH